jgi:uncharacterized membrane protein HdeD (DUF308 family)
MSHSVHGADYGRDLPDSTASRTGFIILGLLLVIVGLLSIAMPWAASYAIEVSIGLAFIATGAFQLIQAFWAKGWAGVAWELLIGALFLVAGIMLLNRPTLGLISVTLVLIATFLAAGVLRIVMALALRPRRGWLSFLLLGVLSLIVGGLIWSRFPSSAAWSIGLLAGVDFFFTGLVFLQLGLASRRNSVRVG